MKTLWNEKELMAEHEYARPHQAAGLKLHGGFDEAGNYTSPRTKYRWDAVKAWQAQLKAKGAVLLDASENLLERGNYPNSKQQSLLLSEGLGKSFWDGLTITGIIEARGAALVNYTPPNLQAIIEEDITETAVGHLHKGLLVAHGLDEGGNPNEEGGLGAHDAMWFAVRDLIFGANAFDMPEMPPSIERPKDGVFFPQLPDEVDILFTLLLDVLMIEIRAAAYFDFCVEVISAKENFADRAKEKALAVEMVERIRIDENIHVAYLQTTISELRSFTFKSKGGERISGAKLIDPVWSSMVEWHGKTQFDIVRKQRKEGFDEEIKAQLSGRANNFLQQFNAAENEIKTAAE